MRSSVATDWKFSGVILSCGMVKSNSASTPSIRLTMSIEVSPISTSGASAVTSAEIEFCSRIPFTRITIRFRMSASRLGIAGLITHAGSGAYSRSIAEKLCRGFGVNADFYFNANATAENRDRYDGLTVDFERDAFTLIFIDAFE